MSEILTTLFSKEPSASEKVAAFADLMAMLLNYVLKTIGYKEDEATAE